MSKTDGSDTSRSRSASRGRQRTGKKSPPAAAPGKVEPQEKSDPITIAKVLSEYSIPVSGTPETLNRFKSATGLGCHRVDGANPHAISAACRYAATVFATRHWVTRGGKRMLSYMGSQREEGLFSAVNNKATEGRIELLSYRPILNARDLPRDVQMNQITVPGPNMFDGILMPDVYQTSAGPLTPNVVAELVAMTPNGAGSLYWIGHRFDGAAGTIHGEGGWIRVLDPKKPKKRSAILQRPDNESPAYGPHAPLDWLTHHGSCETARGHLGWALLRQFDRDTYVFEFSLHEYIQPSMPLVSPPGFEIVPLEIAPAGYLTEKLHQLTDYLGLPWVAETATRPAIISTGLVQEAKAYLLPRARTIYALRQMQQMLSTGNKSTRLLMQLFPMQMEDLIANTANYAFYNHSAALARDARSLTRLHGNNLHAYNEAQAKLFDSTERPFNKWWLLLLLIPLYLMRNVVHWRGLLRAIMMRAINTIAPSRKMELQAAWEAAQGNMYKAFRRLCATAANASVVVERTHRDLPTAQAIAGQAQATGLKTFRQVCTTAASASKTFEDGVKYAGPALKRTGTATAEYAHYIGQVVATSAPARRVSALTSATCTQMSNVLKPSARQTASQIMASVHAQAQARQELGVLAGTMAQGSLEAFAYSVWNWLRPSAPVRPLARSVQEAIANFGDAYFLAAIAGQTLDTLKGFCYSLPIIALGAGIEECVKRWGPRSHNLLVWGEFAMKMVFLSQQHSMGNISNRQIVPNLVCAYAATRMHNYTVKQSWLRGTLTHTAWNACVYVLVSKVDRNYHFFSGSAPIDRNTPWKIFKQTFYSEPWELRQWTHEEVRVTHYALEDMTVPSEMTPSYKEKPQCPLSKVRSTLTPEVQPVPTQRTYWFFATNVPGYRPGRSDLNLLAVCQARLLVAAPMDPDAQMASWSTVRPLTHQMESLANRELYEAEWLTHFTGPKLRRAREALRRTRLEPVTPEDAVCQTAKVMVKTDELLYKMEGHQLQMKPRAIININPLVQATVGPFLMEITKRLKTIFPWTLEPVPNQKDYPNFYCTYAGDATDGALTNWLAAVSDLSGPFVAILASGDDSLVIDARWGRWVIYESDFSMFDQSQSKGPLALNLRTFSNLGLPALEAEVLWKTYEANYAAYGKHDGRLLINHRKRPMRATGGADTSVGNTLCTLTAWAHVLQQHKPPLQAFRELGFDIKLCTLCDIAQATFLKGRWYRCGAKRVWAPLPSRFVKMGKSYRDPRTLYATKNLALATTWFAQDVASSYGSYARAPLIRDFVDNFATRVAQPLRPEDIWVQADGTQKGMELEWEEALGERYDAEASEFETLSSMIKGQRICTFIEHPLLAKLVLRDYA